MVGHGRENDRGENQEPQQGAELFRRNPQGETLEAAFFVQQDDGDDADAECEPVHFVRRGGAETEGEQGGELGGQIRVR